MKKIEFIIYLFSILISAFCVAQIPFPAETAVVVSKAGSNSHYTLYTIPNAGMENALGFTSCATVDFSPHEVNGVGLNNVDKLLYSAVYSDNGTPENLTDDVHLYRIGADGTYQDLGVLPVTGEGKNVSDRGYKVKVEYVNFLAGTVYNDKYIYFTIALSHLGKMESVIASRKKLLDLDADDITIYVAEIDNISSLTSTPAAPSRYYKLDISNARVKAAVNAFVQSFNDNYNNTPGNWGDKLYSASRTESGFHDIDVHPETGLLYSYINYPHPTLGGEDMVGFPIAANLNASRKAYIANPVGTITNEVPSSPLVGLAFNIAGNHLYALFASGEYGEIDLTTGGVNILDVSNIHNDGMGLMNMRSGAEYTLLGDMARPFGDIVNPVQFGTIQALLAKEGLIVNWQTLSEVNNHHFDIEVSVDGKHFTKVATVLSKAQLVSNTPLDYTHTIDRSALPLGVLSVSVLGLMSLAGLGRRVSKWGVAMMIALTGMGLYACSKSDVVNTGTDKTIYVRIAQVDIDGTTTYSKVIKAVKS